MKRIGFIDGRRVAGWRFPATDSPGNGQVLTVDDYSPETAYPKTLKYTVLGVKTALYTIADWLEISIKNTVVLGYGKWIDVDSVDNPAIGHFSGQVINMRDPGDNCDGWLCQDLNFFCVGTPAGRFSFIKCRTHTAVIPTSVISLEGAPNATYLLGIAQTTPPHYLGSADASGASTHHLKIMVAGTEYRIPLYVG